MQNVLMHPRAGLERKDGNRAPENKNGGVIRVTPEVKELFDDLADSFNQFRVKQDSRYDDLKAQLDQAKIEGKRPIVKGCESQTPSVLPKAWNDYLRHGIELPPEQK